MCQSDHFPAPFHIRTAPIGSFPPQTCTHVGEYVMHDVMLAYQGEFLMIESRLWLKGSWLAFCPWMICCRWYEKRQKICRSIFLADVISSFLLRYSEIVGEDPQTTTACRYGSAQIRERNDREKAATCALTITKNFASRFCLLDANKSRLPRHLRAIYI